MSTSLQNRSNYINKCVSWNQEKCLINLYIVPDHDVEHLGKTVIVTRTGLDSLPPQSVATTEST